MKLELDAATGRYQIRSYSQASITVNEQVLTRSCVIMPDTLITQWPPQSFAELMPEHFAMIADIGPEIVLLGTGRVTRFPGAAVIAPLLSRHIGFEALDTAAACRSYSVLVAEGRRVAAALLMPQVDS